MDRAENDVTDLLRQDFDLPEGSLTEQELLEWLARRVEELLRYRPEYFMSLCYTLDLNEDAVAAALAPAPGGAAPPARLARLLYDRQRRRVATKQAVRTPPLADPNAW